VVGYLQHTEAGFVGREARFPRSLVLRCRMEWQHRRRVRRNLKRADEQLDAFGQIQLWLTSFLPSEASVAASKVDTADGSATFWLSCDGQSLEIEISGIADWAALNPRDVLRDDILEQIAAGDAWTEYPVGSYSEQNWAEGLS
jgi:hypothetical protein